MKVREIAEMIGYVIGIYALVFAIVLAIATVFVWAFGGFSERFYG